MLEKYMQNCKSEIARTLYTNIFVALKAITWLFTSAPLIRQLLINIPFSNQNNLQNIINRQEYAYYIEILFAFSFVHYIYFKFQEAKDGSLTLNSLFDIKCNPAMCVCPGTFSDTDTYLWLETS